MILRPCLIFIFLAFFFIGAQAQSEMQDVVYLKNGGVTRGVILEIIPDSTLKIQTIDKSIFVYTFKEIIKVVKENVPEVEKKEEKVVDPYSSKIEYLEITTEPEDQAPKEGYKKSGYHGIIKFGPLGITTFNINFINGYQFNPYILLGLGVGLDTYHNIGNSPLASGNTPFDGDSKRSDHFIPIYMDFRFHVSSSKATFFTYINMGYSMHYDGVGSLDTATTSSSSYSYYGESRYLVKKGGTFFCPGIGFKVFITKNVGIVGDFGFKFQNYEGLVYHSEYDNNGNYYYKLGGHFNKIAVSPMINFGVAF